MPERRFAETHSPSHFRLLKPRKKRKRKQKQKKKKNASSHLRDYFPFFSPFRSFRDAKRGETAKNARALFPRFFLSLSFSLLLFFPFIVDSSWNRIQDASKQLITTVERGDSRDLLCAASFHTYDQPNPASQGKRRPLAAALLPFTEH